MKKLTYTEQLELEEGLPHKPVPSDVFNMGIGQEKPLENFVYGGDPKRPGTVTISLSKNQYESLDEARSRAEELFELRKVSCYYVFQTGRHYVFWCLPGVK